MEKRPTVSPIFIGVVGIFLVIICVGIWYVTSKKDSGSPASSGSPGPAPGPARSPGTPATTPSIPSGTSGAVQSAPVVPSSAGSVSGDTATAQSTLNPGDKLTSADGRYKAIMQADGNFVVYDASGAAIWALQTVNVPCCVPGRHAVMQGDGNFVIYNSDGSAAWSARTNNSYSPSKLIMQNDGNLVVYDSRGIAKWSTYGGTTGN